MTMLRLHLKQLLLRRKQSPHQRTGESTREHTPAEGGEVILLKLRGVMMHGIVDSRHLSPTEGASRQAGNSAEAVL